MAIFHAFRKTQKVWKLVNYEKNKYVPINGSENVSKEIFIQHFSIVVNHILDSYKNYIISSTMHPLLRLRIFLEYFGTYDLNIILIKLRSNK